MSRALAVRAFRKVTDYDDVMRVMRATHEDVRRAASGFVRGETRDDADYRSAPPARDALLLCQHAPVITIGRRKVLGASHVRSSVEELRRAGIALRETDRGGDATYHGPGQLVAYPVVSLRGAGLGARAYVEGLERFASEALRGLGIDARGGYKGREGVWVGDAKIAAVGVKISSGVSSHGVAFNVDPDLRHFEHIIPCGLEGYEVTSVTNELGRTVDMVEVETRIVDAFARTFGYRHVTTSIEDAN